MVRLDVVYTFGHEVNDLKITSALDRITQSDHRNLLQIGEGDDTRQGVLDATNPEADIDVHGPAFFETIADFLVLGVEHIVTGYDHLAFLDGLLLIDNDTSSL